MGKRINQALLAILGAGAILLAMPGLAGACLVLGTNASLTMQGPSSAPVDAYGSTGMSGPVGSYVTVRGTGWATGVQMHFTWAGNPLSTPFPVDGPDFQVSVRVPSGNVGSSYILAASQPGAQDVNLRQGTGHPFEVTNADGSVPNSSSHAPAGPTSLSVTGSPSIASSGGSASPGGSPAPAGQSASSVVIPGPATTEGPATGATTAPAPATGATTATAASPSARNAGPAAAAAAAAAVTTEGPGSVVASGSVPAQGVAGAAIAADTTANPNTTPAAVAASPSSPSSPSSPFSPRSATGELWTGFGARSGLAAPGLASLPATTGGPSQAAMGFGLLAAGSVALLGGFGVAELRRRRALAPVGYDN